MKSHHKLSRYHKTCHSELFSSFSNPTKQIQARYRFSSKNRITNSIDPLISKFKEFGITKGAIFYLVNNKSLILTRAINMNKYDETLKKLKDYPDCDISDILVHCPSILLMSQIEIDKIIKDAKKYNVPGHDLAGMFLEKTKDDIKPSLKSLKDHLLSDPGFLKLLNKNISKLLSQEICSNEFTQFREAVSILEKREEKLIAFCKALKLLKEGPITSETILNLQIVKPANIDKNKINDFKLLLRNVSQNERTATMQKLILELIEVLPANNILNLIKKIPIQEINKSKAGIIRELLIQNKNFSIQSVISNLLFLIPDVHKLNEYINKYDDLDLIIKEINSKNLESNKKPSLISEK